MNRREFVFGTAGLLAVRPRLQAYEPPSRITTGLPSLDALTGSLGAGEVVQIAGRLSSGRTGLALQIASHVSATAPVAYFSPFVDSIGEFEMDTKKSCLHRMAFALAGVELTAFDCGQLTEDSRARCRRAASTLAERPLYLYGTREVKDCDIEKLGAVARGLSRNIALRLIVVDDLMKLHPRQFWSQTRTMAELEAMGRFFKELAEELRATIIVFSGLDLGLLRGKSNLPSVSDLRGFGLPLRYCSTVALTHRELFWRRDIEKFETQADVFVTKSLTGRVGRLHMAWDRKNAQFAEAMRYGPTH